MCACVCVPVCARAYVYACVEESGRVCGWRLHKRQVQRRSRAAADERRNEADCAAVECACGDA